MSYRERNVSIDIAKGFAMILVVIGHCGVIGNIQLKNVIYSFHMPLFFIFAGYFFHSQYFLTSLKKDFNRLIIPYLVFAGVRSLKFTTTDILKGDYDIILDRWIAFFYANAGAHPSFYLSDVPAIGVLWFLPSLFFCKNIYNIIFQTNNNAYIYYCIIISISATAIDTFLINLPFGILTGGSAIVFYLIGDLYHKGNIPRWIIVFTMVMWLACSSFVSMSIGNGRYYCYPLNILCAFGGTMVVYYTSIYIAKQKNYLANFISNRLAWLGKYSLVVLCMHYLVILIDINTRLRTENPVIWLIIDFLQIIPLTYLCTKLTITKKLFVIK